MEIRKRIESHPQNLSNSKETGELIRYINLKLASMGLPIYTGSDQNLLEIIEGSKDISSMREGFGKYLSDIDFITLSENLLEDYREKARILREHLPPTDRRIETFLSEYMKGTDLESKMKLPRTTFVLDRYGMAREMSIAPDKNEFTTSYIRSFRIKQGILHNPKHDRRTTKGSFHIVEGGLPVPLDKKEVPREAFAHMFHAAVNPPDDMMILPFTSSQKEKAAVFVSLLLRPLVSPEVKGIRTEKRMETRFFVPGSLVSNLDFVESIFGNWGDPGLPVNDPALDSDRFSGHTGCIILAPHLTLMTKKELGLPKFENATERQKDEGMFYRDEGELYNDGIPFKITCRDEKGVVVTLIGDNYFGYSKKEIKTQISYAANLMGMVEEEHAGGTVAFSRRSMGEQFFGRHLMKKYPHTFEDVKKTFSKMIDEKPGNYATDKKFPNIVYLPEDAEIQLYNATVTWVDEGRKMRIKLLPNQHYFHPSGHRIHMEKHPASPAWRLVSTSPVGVFCHKPCTVSGGGKSEISKSLLNAIIYGPFYVHNIEKDLELAEKVINFDYSNRWKTESKRTKPSRHVLSWERTLGSVIKLLTPSPLHTDKYNDFVESIPDHVKALVLLIKRFYREEWGDNWKKFFNVDRINGKEGHALFFNGRKVMAGYLRIGFAGDNSWFLHKLRTDFIASAKIQMEDDITSSIVLSDSYFGGRGERSLKITENCEFRFFQRPDEAITRGYDKEAEADLSMKNNFTTNYEPLTPIDAKNLIEDAIGFDQYTKPIQDIIVEGKKGKYGSYFISPAHPRVIEQKRSKNPRYLQLRHDFTNPEEYYLAEIAKRLFEKVSPDKPIHFPVDAVLPARRNNPADREKGIKALSIYNPIHYQELPELFMDFIASLTGKSPSTTGAGSEGALTKGPFNMLSPTTDLNNALLSYILCGYNGFTTPAGYIGHKYRIDHDISILIPEIWCRFRAEERDPQEMIEDGALEKVDDFEHRGKTVPASRLGYRITGKFLYHFLNRVFDEPQAVFPVDMLRPELQDIENFVDGIENIVGTHKKIAKLYFDDGSIEAAIPPLKALLNIMAYGHYEDRDITHPEIRKMFTRKEVLSSDWYRKRLELQRDRNSALMKRHIAYINRFLSNKINLDVSEKLGLEERLKRAKEELRDIESPTYISTLEGTIGADPLFKK